MNSSRFYLDGLVREGQYIRLTIRDNQVVVSTGVTDASRRSSIAILRKDDALALGYAMIGFAMGLDDEPSP